MADVQIRNVTKSFGEHAAVSGVEISAPDAV